MRHRVEYLDTSSPLPNVRLAVDYMRRSEDRRIAGDMYEWAAYLRLAGAYATEATFGHITNRAARQTLITESNLNFLAADILAKDKQIAALDAPEEEA